MLPTQRLLALVATLVLARVLAGLALLLYEADLTGPARLLVRAATWLGRTSR